MKNNTFIKKSHNLSNVIDSGILIFNLIKEMLEIFQATRTFLKTIDNVYQHFFEVPKESTISFYPNLVGSSTTIPDHTEIAGVIPDHTEIAGVITDCTQE